MMKLLLLATAASALDYLSSLKTPPSVRAPPKSGRSRSQAARTRAERSATKCSGLAWEAEMGKMTPETGAFGGGWNGRPSGPHLPVVRRGCVERG